MMIDSAADTHTALYCVLGDPVAHSLSPVMHNRAFAHLGLNAVYLAFRVTDLEAAIGGLRALDIRGASITLPHKSRVMAYLDDIDPVAAEIGAVNTIINEKGRLIGKNSDVFGAVAALRDKTDPAAKKVLILGAGGAARAVGYGVRSAGFRVTIANRSPEAGAALAADLEADFLPLADAIPDHFDILINTTPVGMHPAHAVSPIPDDSLSADMVVMDIIYNPLETRLLKAAGRAGCRTIDGLAMFVNQGARQFEWWTGREAPVNLMRQVVFEKLREFI